MKISGIVLIGGIVLAGASAFAQETTTNEVAAKNVENEHPDLKYNAMLDALDLTEEQRVKVKEIQENCRGLKRTLEADNTLTEESRKVKISELHQVKRESINAILTDSQRHKLKEMKDGQNDENDKTLGEKAEAQTQRLKESLSLTDEQVVKVRDLNLTVLTKIEAIQKNESLTDEKKREFIKGNKEDHKRVMESILTADQLKKYEDTLAARRNMRPGVKPEQREEAPEGVNE